MNYFYTYMQKKFNMQYIMNLYVCIYNIYMHVYT